MPTQQEIQGQHELLAAHRQTLAVYLKQRALHSEAYVPPAVEHGIRESRQQIRTIKARLHQWGISVADHPDDEAATEMANGAGRKRLARVFVVIGTLITVVGFGIFGYFVLTFIVTVFGFLFAGGTEPPDFSSLFANVPLHWLPIGIGVGFAGMVVTVLGNLIGGERPLTRR